MIRTIPKGVIARNARKSSRARKAWYAFTLIEMLVVITIIGILLGLTLAGVNAARLSVLRGIAKYEIQQLDKAVEAYKAKHGDYPPDGSSWPIVENHLRSVFPQILSSELALLNPALSASNGGIRNDNDLTGERVFDPAEALVFFLGGFSSDPQRPLTGPGGPFVLSTTGTGYAYNTARENSFFEFKTGRLTLGTFAGGAMSNDETLFSEGVANDLMPVYVGAGPTIEQGGRPIVYFDSRTYTFVTPSTTYFNFYTAGPVASGVNCARPYLSNESDNSAVSHSSAPDASDPKPKRYANEKTFQLISPGYDNLYGSRPASQVASNGMVLFTSPGGIPCTPLVDSGTGMMRFYKNAGVFPVKYKLPENGTLNPAFDNVANFVEGSTLSQSK